MSPLFKTLFIIGIIIIIALILFIFIRFTKKHKNIYDMEANDNNNNINLVDDAKMYKRLFSYMKPYTKLYILAIILTGITVFLDILNPKIWSLSLDEIGKEEINYTLVVVYFIVGVGLAILMRVVLWFMTIILHTAGHSITKQIRADVFSHIQKLSHNQFNNIPVGTLVTRATSDVSVLFELYTSIIVNIIKYAATIIGVFVAMLILNVDLSLIVLAIFPLILSLTLIFRTVMRKVHRKVRTEVSNMNAFLSENISGMQVTQIFNQEEKKYNEFKKANNRLKKASLKEIFSFSIFRPSVFLIYFTTVLLVLMFGSNSIIEANFGATAACITYSELYMFYQYISKFFDPIQNLAEQYNQLQSAFAAGEKIFRILDIVPEIQDEEGAIDIDLKGTIEFKNVWFAYIKDEWILKDVSFKIEPMDTVAFVGATGAGKSTILGLITRNYDIQKGQILVDGIDIKHIKLESLRGQIGQMLQDVFLFSGTIKDNIRLWNDDITDDEIIEACKEVNANHFIDKDPKGIYQEVIERGNNLSQGEKQLVSFARVLVHKPKVMILDEATSNIDTETEKLIQESLEKVINNNTMIMVAHRLSTIQHANKIIVFDHGKIIEQGDHQELLKKRGRYYQLYMLQYQKGNYNG